jgi:hypothetical protein
MPLRLRRGTDSERQNQATAFPEGELVYTTDTKQLYVGDGSTIGGVLVSGSGGAGSTTLYNLTDTDLDGVADGEVLTYIAATGKWEPTAIPGAGNIGLQDLSDVQFNGSPNTFDFLIYDGFNFINVPIQEIFQEQQNYRINIVADDSTIMVNGDTGEFNGTLNGDVRNGTLYGNVENPGGTVMVDTNNNTLSNNDLLLDNNSIKPLVSDHIALDTSLVIQKGYGVSNDPNLASQLVIEGYRGTDAAPLAVQSGDYISALVLSGWDGTISLPKVQLTTAIDAVTGTNALPGKLLINTHDYDGGYSVAASFDSRGTFEAPTFKATPYDDPTARDAAITSPEAGMIVFLTDSTGLGGPAKLQGYDGSAWQNLF